MQTPAMSGNPMKAVAPAPADQRSSAPASGSGTGFGDVLAREVSQQDARVKERDLPEERTNATAKPDGEETAAGPVDSGAQGSASVAEAPMAPADATPVVDTAGANGLLALVTSLASKADTAAAPAAGASVDLVAAAASARLDRATPRLEVVDGQQNVEPAADLGKSQRAGGPALPPGEGFAAALGRVADDAALRDAGRAVPQETLPDPTLRAPSVAATPLMAAAVAVPGADRLTARVGTPAWDNALGQRVVWMAGAHEQSATLTLNPPDLGPLQVVLSVTNNQADATFVATQPEVRQALEAAMPRLREMLGDAGVTLREATVSAESRDSQQAFQQAQRQGDGGRDRGGDGPAGREIRSGNVVVRAGRGLVDTFA